MLLRKMHPTCRVEREMEHSYEAGELQAMPAMALPSDGDASA